MFDFEPFDFEPGNMFYVGMQEELEEEIVNDAVDYIRSHYGDSLSVDQMEAVFSAFDIS